MKPWHRGGPLTAVPVRAILFPSHVTRERRRLTHGHQCPQRPQNDGGPDPGLPGPAGNFETVPRTLAGLGRIQLAHKIMVPFENLDIVAGRPPVPGPAPSLRQDCGPPPGRGVRGAEHPVQLAALLYGLCGDQLQCPDALSPTYLFRRHRILAVELEGKTYTTDVGFATENARVPLELTEGRSRATATASTVTSGSPSSVGSSPSAGRGVTGSGSRPLPWNPRLTGTLTRCFSSLKRARSPT